MAVWSLPDWDEAELARRWRSATPFPHIVIDDFVSQNGLGELLAIVEDEAIERYEADIYVFEATPPTPKTEALKLLRDAFATALAGPLSRITSRHVTRADLRAYAYREGHFLLPHSDHQLGVGRALAYAYYLPTAEPIVGGELELFRVEMAGGEITRTESACLIEPRANRLVVFDVSDVSLHQVREVTGGLRASLSGWFYP
jgi:Rps23 Pro-64 3,4-dihydroxylase Tpa1-like proline 4-hydroxylase